MKTRLDMNKIAIGLEAQRRGKLTASGGYFGALQLLADVQAGFRVPWDLLLKAAKRFQK